MTRRWSTGPGRWTALQLGSGARSSEDNTIYGGTALGNPTSNIVITDNRFGQLYYPLSGQYGPVAYFNPAGTGNLWSGNTWDTTGQAIPSP
jgi:hypothetical protein